MATTSRVPLVFLTLSTLMAVSACKPEVLLPDDVAGTETGSAEEAEAETTDTEAEAETDETETGATFVPDMPPEAVCDPWAQDCPEAEKCVPYTNDGSNWNANHCVPITGDGQVGDACIYDGINFGTDSCGADSHCWDAMEVDGQLQGVCTAFCDGSPDEPLCGPDTACLIANEGTINLCVATCDPIAQDCGDGLGCFWGGDEFQCIFTAGEILGGEPCGFINDCAPGNMCATADVVPNCNGTACCTPFCDLAEPACGDPATECSAFFEEGMAPPGYESIGVCVLPGA